MVSYPVIEHRAGQFVGSLVCACPAGFFLTHFQGHDDYFDSGINRGVVALGPCNIVSPQELCGNDQFEPGLGERVQDILGLPLELDLFRQAGQDLYLLL